MIATLVFVDVKPENVEDFRKITVYNHENSRKEAAMSALTFCKAKTTPPNLR